MSYAVVLEGDLEKNKDQVIAQCISLTEQDLMCVLPTTLSYVDEIKKAHIRYSFISHPDPLQFTESQDTDNSVHPNLRAKWTGWMREFITARGIMFFPPGARASTWTKLLAMCAFNSLRIEQGLNPVWIALCGWTTRESWIELLEDNHHPFIQLFIPGDTNGVTHFILGQFDCGPKDENNRLLATSKEICPERGCNGIIVRINPKEKRCSQWPGHHTYKV